ncbi:T9SS type A sorting domain-containing protein, partial [bacterium]|nr:T9SS type A sorting domain-containing protein [bacterium]
IAIAGTDIFVSESGIVRRYDTSGAMVDSAFTTGTVHSIGPAGTDFAGLVVARADTLLAIDTLTKAETLILTGPGSTGSMAVFDSAGDLYISQGGDLDRVLHVTQSGPSGIDNVETIGAGLALRVGPNPASGSMTIRLAARTSGPVQIDLFDVRGRRLRRVHDGFVPTHGGIWNLDVGSLAGGVYFVSARTRDGRATERVVLVR